jgi:hypothetical protein
MHTCKGVRGAEIGESAAHKEHARATKKTTMRCAIAGRWRVWKMHRKIWPQRGRGDEGLARRRLGRGVTAARRLGGGVAYLAEWI